jgi:hypothetical protein
MCDEGADVPALKDSDDFRVRIIRGLSFEYYGMRCSKALSQEARLFGGILRVNTLCSDIFRILGAGLYSKRQGIFCR